uniref:Carboxylesterase type B domain-containing protein n=1 Tax=Heliothis virescens TaxID=7102 RepID=A0A2A4IWX2_HELVI
MEAIKSCLVIFVLFSIKIITADVIVETSLGKVAGIEVKSILKDEKYYSFMGIPYGMPPAGKTRFLPPQPHEGWSDVLPAKKERKPCSHMNIPNRPLKNYGFSGQDDCLHLSIYTPKVPSNEDLGMPVIVFLYNELFKVSHNASKEFGPDFFVKEGAIVVSVSHRIGSMGFLAFNDEIVPGNNGIRDIILALKWLQQNVHKFGGDPQKITLMGVDGGAAIIDVLLLSPKAKGLFSRAILQSGTAFNPIYMPTNPKVKATALAKELERTAVTSSNLLNELQHVSSYDLVTAELSSVSADEGRQSQMGTVPFGPVTEPEHPDAIITHLPEDGPLDIDIPVMIGYNSREGIEINERYLRKPQYLTFADRDFLVVIPVRSDFRFELNSNIYHEAIDEIKEFYFDEGYVKISKPGEYLTYTADIMNFYPIDYAVRKYVNESRSSVYYYTFDYSGELNMRKNEILESAMTIEGTWGAAPADELCYLFLCKPIRKIYKKVLEDEDAEELKVLRNMVKLWTNFAKTGNPTPEGSDFTWTPATKENKDCLVISDELQMKKNLHDDRIKFWDNFLVKYKALAVNGVVKDGKDEL